MTKIGGASRSVASLLDQIGNTRSDQTGSSTSKDGKGSAAFDSHFAKLTADANAASGSQTGDQNAAALKNTAANAASAKGTQQNSVSALFAALTGDDPAQTAASDLTALGTNAVQQDTATGKDQSAKKTTDAATALFAALAGGDQSSEAETTASTSQSTAQQQASLSKLMSLANKSAPQTNSANDGNLSLAKALFASQASTSTSTSATSTSSLAKRSLNAATTDSKDADQTATNAPTDLSASALVAASMVAASLTPQNNGNTPLVRKEAAAAGGSQSNIPALKKDASAGTSDASAAQSDTIQSLTQQTSFSPLGDLSDTGDSASTTTIKMPVSSIQAGTHFAPVQQLSPTQQIVDFVAMSANSIASAAPSTDDAAAATDSSASSGSSAPSTSSPTAMSFSNSPVKTLTLALEPDALGTVTIKMRLVDSGLDLQVEAENSQTTSLIEKDKSNLSDKLQSLGYTVDSLVVKTVATQSSNLDSSSGQTSQGQGQTASNDASAFASSQNGGRNTNDQSPTQSGRQTGSGLNREAVADGSAARDVGDGVYV